jgi:hypothetical protein
MQGFAYNDTAQRTRSWNKHMNQGEHETDAEQNCSVGFCAGNLHQNEVYCSKVGSLIEFGDKPQNNGCKRC